MDEGAPASASAPTDAATADQPTAEPEVVAAETADTGVLGDESVNNESLSVDAPSTSNE